MEVKGSIWRIIILIGGIVFFIYSLYIEPHRIEISKVTIRIKGLSDALNGFSMVHLSDLHLGKIGKREAKLVKAVNELKPDILVITGDFVNKREMIDGCIQLINKFRTRHGKWGVWGNYDYSILNPTDRKKLAESGIVILTNENQSIVVNQQKIWIIGVDDPVKGYDNLSRAMTGVPEGDFKLLMTHSPAIIDEANRGGVDLVVAGHTHGGQVYLPLISHLIVRLHGGERYIGGLYRVGQTYLYVSRGIGTSLLPLRAFSPPEITLIKLEKEKTHATPPPKPVSKTGFKEAMFYHGLPDNKAQCQLCFRRCIIAEGKRGFCRVRENRGGRLYSLVYGKIYSWQVAPIEKDGMYHLLPGTRLLALATASCNFRCKHCHNWTLTQVGPQDLHYYECSPEEVVEKAIKRGARTISGTMNEPTIFYEYLYDIAKIAKRKGIKVQFHTNGGLNPEPLRELLKYVDGVVVDLKGFTEKFYQETSSAELGPVLKTLKIIKEEGVWLEITNLIIPTLNDDLKDIRRMCKWIRDDLGEDTPIHFTRFSPAYKLTHLPLTPVKTLEEAAKIAKSVGLKYVYIGNVPGHIYNSTFCPKCKKRLIHRIHFTVLTNNVEDGKCGFCQYKIPGIWG